MIAHLAFYVGWPNAFSALPSPRTYSTNAPAERNEGVRPWKSNEAAHGPPARGPPNSSPAPCGSIRCSSAGAGAGRGASVTFEPGARTAWHTHPLGQTLIVTAGCGRAQR